MSSKQRKSPSPVSENISRQIQPATRLYLAVYAGGHCEFDGCPRFLYQHHVTKRTGNYAELAHIVAFKVEGPRGSDSSRAKINDINEIDNLMLLCPTCHKEIDDHPDKYSVRTLREYKEQHERRIRYLTSLDKEHNTHVIRLKARINGQAVSVPKKAVFEAVAPYYPEDPDCLVDLTEIEGENEAYYETAMNAIRKRVCGFLDSYSVERVSVFALGPIPLLAFLGSLISNKIDVQFFQYHRDNKSWTWQRGETPVEFGIRIRHTGSVTGPAALLLSISGTVDFAKVKPIVGRTCSIYEIYPTNAESSTLLLSRLEDLNNFKRAFENVLARIVEAHGSVKPIKLFPAIPAPVAVCCGHLPLSKAHPPLDVFDLSADKKRFKKTITVNQYEAQ